MERFHGALLCRLPTGLFFVTFDHLFFSLFGFVIKHMDQLFGQLGYFVGVALCQDVFRDFSPRSLRFLGNETPQSWSENNNAQKKDEQKNYDRRMISRRGSCLTLACLQPKQSANRRHAVFLARIRKLSMQGEASKLRTDHGREGHMPGHERRVTILLASLDPALTKLRKRVLEIAGYRVVAVESVAQIASECRNRTIDLVLIGTSLSAVQKRTFWAEFRSHCSSIVLELYRDESPELMDDLRAYVHHAVTSVDFVDAVKAVLPPA